jgi:hypothetical protein
MLFDLQGPRKSAVKVIYLGLAILMGGGLVLFGVGSSVNGGLADVFSGGGGSGDLQKQVNTSAEKVAANPQNVKALEDLIGDRYSLALSTADQKTGVYTKAGKAQLTLLAKNWTTYQKLNPKPNLVTAANAVSAYVGLNDAKGAQKAQEIVAAKQANAANYLQLLQFALYSGDSLAATGAELKARELATKDQKSEVDSTIKSLKKQFASQSAAAQKQIQQQFAEQQKSGAAGQSSPFSSGK